VILLANHVAVGHKTYFTFASSPAAQLYAPDKIECQKNNSKKSLKNYCRKIVGRVFGQARNSIPQFYQYCGR
jgi:hypothetical protein